MKLCDPDWISKNPQIVPKTQDYYQTGQGSGQGLVVFKGITGNIKKDCLQFFLPQKNVLNYYISSGITS